MQLSETAFERKLSHTSTSTFRRCRQRYQWQYVDNLAPLPSMGLVRGSVGHAAMEVWYDPHAFEYDDTMEPDYDPRDIAMQVASNKLAEYEGLLDRDLNNEWDLIATVLNRYFDWSTINDDFNLIDTERQETIDIGPFKFTGIIDGIVRYNDHLWLLEHKFWKRVSLGNLDLDPQVSLYLMLVRKLGYDVKGVLYNIIRMAKGGIAESEPVVRVPLYRNNEGLNYLIEELHQQMAEMRLFHEGKLPVYRNPTRDCSWDCGFYNACLALNDTGSAESILNTIPIRVFPEEDEGDDSE